jgi:hypothetical protein
MLPTEALRRIALFAGQVDGIREAFYPVRAQPPQYPGLALLMGPVVLDYMSTEQHWSPMEARGLLMTGLVNDTKKHVAEVDPLIAPLVDMFAAGNRAAILDIGDGDRVDSCLIRSVEPSQEIGYAGHSHFGAVVIWHVYMRRFNSDA